MTTVFLDAPGKTLESTSEPLDFSCTTVPVAISVGFGSARVEERVYRDGAFLPGYQRSRANAGVFSIVRDQPWPSNPQLYVDEKETAPPIGQTMGAIYEVDLTAQPSQTMTAPGQYTINGKVWWAKGALTALGTTQTCALVNGTGLRMTRPDPITGGPNFHQAGVYSNRVMCFDIGQLADYNPLAPLVVAWRFVSPFLASQDEAAFRNVFGGLMTVAPNATAITQSDGAGVNLRRINTSGVYWRRPLNTNSLVPTIVPSQSDVLGNVVQGVYRYSAGRYLPLVGVWNGTSLEGPDSMSLLRTDDAQHRVCEAAQITAGNPSFVFACDKGSNNGSTMDFALTHLKVLQPKVAA